jgi:hypothetical protein
MKSSVMQTDKTASYRKDISDHKWLQSRNCSTPYYRQCRVIMSADDDGSPQLNSQRRGSKTQKMFFSPGGGKWFFGTEQTIWLLGKFVRMTNRL